MDSSDKALVTIIAVLSGAVAVVLLITVLWSNSAGGCRAKCGERFSSIQETQAAMECFKTCASPAK